MNAGEMRLLARSYSDLFHFSGCHIELFAFHIHPAVFVIVRVSFETKHVKSSLFGLYLLRSPWICLFSGVFSLVKLIEID